MHGTHSIGDKKLEKILGTGGVIGKMYENAFFIPSAGKIDYLHRITLLVLEKLIEIGDPVLPKPPFCHRRFFSVFSFYL